LIQFSKAVKSLCLASVLAVAATGVNAAETGPAKGIKDFDIRMEGQFGYRVDNLSVERDQNAVFPRVRENFAAEVCNVESWVFNPLVYVEWDNKVYLEVEGTVGHVGDGQENHSFFDVTANNNGASQALTYKSENCLTGNKVYAVSVGLGYNIMDFFPEISNLVVRPLIGWAYDSTQFQTRSSDGKVIFAGTGDKLNGYPYTYNHRSNAFWAGLGVGISFTKDQVLSFRGQYFRHNTDLDINGNGVLNGVGHILHVDETGHGYGFEAEYAYQLNSSIQLSTKFRWKRQETGNAKISGSGGFTNPLPGNPNRLTNAPLCGVCWESFAITGGFIYKFGS